MLWIGAMSGTSLDGVSLAAIKTDGEAYLELTSFARVYSFPPDLRTELEALIAQLLEALRTSFPHYPPIKPRAFSLSQEELYRSLPVSLYRRVRLAEEQLTHFHIAVISDFIKTYVISTNEVSGIGFHGQTLLHRPEWGLTLQIGDGALLAESLGIPVVNDFRTADVKAGGQGAPLIPIYHAALVKRAAAQLPAVILNLGGVANISWIGEQTKEQNVGLIGFDCGPGNGLMDAWISEHTQSKYKYDPEGVYASRGKINKSFYAQLISDPFFEKAYPKSLDRYDFDERVKEAKNSLDKPLSLEDGLASLNALSVYGVLQAIKQCPTQARSFFVAGGGRHNRFLMIKLELALADLGIPIEDFEKKLATQGDATEAEGFAYLAARSERGLALSFPNTTGVAKPCTGGSLHRPKQVK